jgi:hypothetical protein
MLASVKSSCSKLVSTRRWSTVLSLSLQLGFPGKTLGCVYGRDISSAKTRATVTYNIANTISPTRGKCYKTFLSVIYEFS